MYWGRERYVAEAARAPSGQGTSAAKRVHGAERGAANRLEIKCSERAVQGPPSRHLASELGASMGGPGRFCRQCGRELRPGAQFCAACGEIARASQPVTHAGEEIARARESDAAMAAAAPGASDTLSRSWPNPGAADPPDGGTNNALPVSESGRDARFLPRDDELRPARSGRPLIVGLAVLAVVGLAATTLLILHPFGHHAPTRPVSISAPPPTPTPTPPPTPTPTPTPTATPTPTLPPEQAAQNLATLLAQSVNDRDSIKNAYNDVLGCGSDLNQDGQTFQNAATSRDQLLSQLADMASQSPLSGSMLGDLTGAWQASIEVDQDYAKWVQDEVSAGCVLNDQSDPNFLAADSPNIQATADKRAFVRLWNHLAKSYGLTTYTQSEL